MRTHDFMKLPEKFRYRNAYEQGKPDHSSFDSFAVKHPPMALSKRAKIFSPFDALKGFHDAVSAKEMLYEDRRDLSEEDMNELNQLLAFLHALTHNGNAARTNQVTITVTYFVCCEDSNHPAYHRQGTYQTYTGMLLHVDYIGRKLVFEDGTTISVDDVWHVSIPPTFPADKVFPTNIRPDTFL